MLHSPVKTVCSCRPLPFSIPGREQSGANPPQSRMNPGFFKTFRTLPQQHLFNEWLVRDTSKKIRAVKRSKGMSGKPVTSKPVYGYLMDEDENFIIDEEAASVVKQIYSLCLAGNGPTKIARMLTEQEIPTPGTLEYRRTGRTRRYHPGYECKWAANTVVHILENREYTGCLMNFKTTTQSYTSPRPAPPPSGLPEGHGQEDIPPPSQCGTGRRLLSAG